MASRRRQNPTNPRRRRSRGLLGRIFSSALKLLFGLSLLAVLAGAVAFAAFYLHLARDLPRFDELVDYRPKESTKVYAADGSLVAEFFEERRTVVPPSEIPDLMKRAILAAEDAHFYAHEGIDYVGILRAFLVNLSAGETRQGGSTITQQVVKTFLLSPERTYERKWKEIILARRLEKNLSKDEILYLYLNQINFGHGRYGVEEGARFYFDKSVRDLTLGEAALLAGIPQAPSYRSPYNRPESAKQRQTYVLDQMLANGWITQEERDAEVERPFVLAPREREEVGPYYAEEVRRYLVKTYGNEKVLTGGLRVHVAMDPALQREATRAVREGLLQYDKRRGYRGALGKLDAALRGKAEEAAREGRAVDLRTLRSRILEEGSVLVGAVESVSATEARVWLGGPSGTLPASGAAWALSKGKKLPQLLKKDELVLVRVADFQAGEPRLELWQEPEIQGALVSIDPATRHVKAMVGGWDFEASSFNRATQAMRQSGSTFKPFVFGAALESGRWTAASLVVDAPETFRDPWTGKDWKPQNYERNRFDGNMTLRRALALSKNTVAVRLISELGVEPVLDFARRAGVQSRQPKNYTLALGTGELTPLELGNAFATLAAGGEFAEPILVTKVMDRDGTVLEENEARPAPAISPALSYVLTRLLETVVAEGTGRRANVLGRPTAGKTGTTSDGRDAWFAGYTADLVTVSWTGFDDPKPLGAGETGGRTALAAWVELMKAAHEGLPPRDFPLPEGVEFAAIDPETGLLAPEGAAPGEFEEAAFVAGTAPTERALAPGLHPADTSLELFMGGGGSPTPDP